MEEEGICYYFRAPTGWQARPDPRDDPTAHNAVPNQKTARYGSYGAARVCEDVVTEWQYQEEFRTGKWMQTDYNFENPSTSLAVSVNGKNPYEIYEYPGEHSVRAEGDKLARIRLQEQTASCMATSHGVSRCRHFTSGSQFTLEGPLSRRFETLATPADRSKALRDVREAVTSRRSGGQEPTYSDFRVHSVLDAVPPGPRHARAVCARLPDRAGRRPGRRGDLHRQIRPGEGAVPLGPGGQEGREQLVLDPRLQSLGRQGWGRCSIPRDRARSDRRFSGRRSDQPIITGRVYNAEQMPPFPLSRPRP